MALLCLKVWIKYGCYTYPNRSVFVDVLIAMTLDSSVLFVSWHGFMSSPIQALALVVPVVVPSSGNVSLCDYGPHYGNIQLWKRTVL